jgi:serine/threonine protein kinase
MEQVHTFNVSHRDIKTENILIDSQFNVKICDFGSGIDLNLQNDNLARLSTAGKRGNFGTLAFNAPEYFKTGEIRSYDKFDIFSLGCILFLMVPKAQPRPSGSTPSSRPNGRTTSSDCSANRTNRSSGSSSASTRYLTNSEVHTDDIDLIERLLNTEPDERLSFGSIRSHAWLQDHPAPDESQQVQELKGLYAHVTEAFLTKSINSIKENNWERFKGFTQRRSRPASACEFSKEITDFLGQRRGELAALLQRFDGQAGKGAPAEQGEKAGHEGVKRTLPGVNLAQPYSVTKMLRNMSSSSSSSSN